MGFAIPLSSGRRLSVEWKSHPEWHPCVTVIHPARLHRGMGYGAWVRSRPVALLAEMPLSEVREQRVLGLRASRNHKLY